MYMSKYACTMHYKIHSLRLHGWCMHACVRFIFKNSLLLYSKRMHACIIMQLNIERVNN